MNVDIASESSIVLCLERSAWKCADRCAVVQEGERISYADLWRRVRSVCAWLERNGLERGDRVALILENSVQYVATFYGALLAGALVVPLNRHAKARDLSIWLEDSGARWLFCEAAAEIHSALKDLTSPPRVVVVGQSDAIWRPFISFEVVVAEPPPSAAPRTPRGEELASILYTSGTTGRPKGVVLSHANIASNTTAIQHYLKLSPDDSIVALLPFYYSYGNSVLNTHLAAGARIIIENNFVYPQIVMERIAAERCTGFSGVPSTYALLLDRVRLGDYDLSSLRYITQAGGPMSPALTRRLRDSLPNCQLFVMYGQTEATARLTYLPPDRLEEKLGSVGIPVHGVDLQIRREDGSIADPMENGEVWVRGPNVMAGYWHDPDATVAVLQDGWLRTGDVGYRDDEGYLYLVGRRTDIIKTGAHRVHPKDVEDVIAEVDGIAEVVVFGVDDPILGQVVKAYIVPSPGATLDLMQVKRIVRARLANYKVPKFMELVAALPKTSSGKVRRVELAEGKPL